MPPLNVIGGGVLFTDVATAKAKYKQGKVCYNYFNLLKILNT